MDKRKKEYFRKRLIEERDRLIKDIGEFQNEHSGNGELENAGATSHYTQHMGELGTDQMEREKSFHFASSERRYLYHIQKAIEKVDTNTFGVCEDCGKKINIERLKIIPSARLCIECKSKEESGRIR